MIRHLAFDPQREAEPAPHVDLPAILAGKLGPVLYHRLSDTRRLATLPPDEREALRRAYADNARHNLILENELHRILAGFDRDRIPIMPIKGAISLIDPLYPSPALRVMSDLDLLVQPDRREAARACLTALGYQPRKGRGTVLPDVEFPMTRGGIVADLHWGLTRTGTSTDGDLVWKRAQPLPAFPRASFFPSNLDQFYIRFLHDTLQDHHLHAVRLWQAYEAALLFRRIERDGNVDALCAQAEEDGLSLVLGVYLAQVDRLFACIALQTPTLQRLLEFGRAEIRTFDSLGTWPHVLHFAVGRDLLLRLRAPCLGGYRRAFIQIMWRECTLAEPTDVVRPSTAARLLHLLRLCLLHMTQAAWRQSRRLRRWIPHRNKTGMEMAWLYVHRNHLATRFPSSASASHPQRLYEWS
ncbi:MAG: nucleotidyltransferase family protein [Nitrospirota bacterium]|nr:nucleotidyltransferase family protein [Nitrospirota bacterium]